MVGCLGEVGSSGTTGGGFSGPEVSAACRLSSEALSDDVVDNETCKRSDGLRHGVVQ